MKKLALMATLALALLGVQSIQAADAPSSSATQGTGFVDKDGDGICDNWTGTKGNGKGQGKHGANFTDKDGNGVCDNWQAGKGKGKGQGQGKGQGAGKRGCCRTGN